jgi:hypothetical protein
MMRYQTSQFVLKHHWYLDSTKYLHLHYNCYLPTEILKKETNLYSLVRTFWGAKIKYVDKVQHLNM